MGNNSLFSHTIGARSIGKQDIGKKRYRTNKKNGRALCTAVSVKVFVLYADYCLIVNVPSFIKRDCPVTPIDDAFSFALIGVPLIDREPTVVVAPFSLLTRT